MKRFSYLAFLAVLTMSIPTCRTNDDNYPQFTPEKLPNFTQVTFASARGDTTDLRYDEKMRLSSGACVSKDFGKERFTVNYNDAGLLTSAQYEMLQGSHWSPFDIGLTLNKHKMVSTLVRQGHQESFEFAYDTQFRLIFFDVHTGEGAHNTYTIEYDGNSNVTKIKWFSSIAGTDGTRTYTYDDYDDKQNPCRLVINTFYLPAFASVYGVLRFDAVPLGWLLSKNNPGVMTETALDGTVTTTFFSYTHDANGYPDSVTSDPALSGYPIEIKYR